MPRAPCALAMTGFFQELRCKSGRRGEGTPPYNHTLCRAGPVCPAGGALENRFGSSGRPTPTLLSTIELRRGRRPRRPVRISYQVLRRARKNPPVTASPCQPPLGKGAVGTGVRIATASVRTGFAMTVFCKKCGGAGRCDHRPLQIVYR